MNSGEGGSQPRSHAPVAAILDGNGVRDTWGQQQFLEGFFMVGAGGGGGGRGWSINTANAAWNFPAPSADFQLNL